MKCMTPLGVKGHIKVKVRLVLVNLIMEQIKPYIALMVQCYCTIKLLIQMKGSVFVINISTIVPALQWFHVQPVAM